jgi:DNA-directed RNA polymerase subunit E'/Rpb7
MNEQLLQSQEIYNRELVSKKVIIPFSELSTNLRQQFVQYAFKNFVGKCCKEGYISNKNIKIIKYSAPKALSSEVLFNVLFEFDIFNPYEGQEIYATVLNVTKIGIKGVVEHDERKNPVTVFASRFQNAHVIMKDENMKDLDYDDTDMTIYGEGDIIKVKVIGYRFEINDTSVYVLGEIIKPNS